MNINQITKESFSYSEIARKLKIPINGAGIRKVKKLTQRLDTSHFCKHSKYKTVIKLCPGCSKPFETKDGGTSAKTTCSYACANSFFRKGLIKLNKKSNYRTICFHYHKKECVIYKENKIVVAHHLDQNHKNNAPENLVPLCPTHHQYFHSRYRKEVEPLINEYINNFKQSVG